MVTVCEACRRASCWHGHFYCAEALSAGTVSVPASVLRDEAREDPSYFRPREAAAVRKRKSAGDGS